MFIGTFLLCKGFSVDRKYKRNLASNKQVSQNILSLKPSYLSLCVMSLFVSGVSTTLYAEENNNVNVYANLPAITVYAERQLEQPVSLTKINRENLDKTGATDMASIVKYLPLVKAPFSVGGSGTFFDGTGTSSYNIRGVDANRIGLDVDGVDLAEATVSTYIPPKSMSQRGAGRDYIEPEMFSSVDIVSGTTDATTDGIGGRVSFKNKSPNDYLVDGKKVAGSFKEGYSSADKAWLTSITGAAGNDTVKALVSYAHREGHETKPNYIVDAFPVDWHSNAALAKLEWNISDQHQLHFAVDYYDKKLDTEEIASNLFSNYKSDATQHQHIDRTKYSIDYIYKPENFILFDKLSSKLWYQESNNNTKTSFMNSATVQRDFSTMFKEKNKGIKLDASKQLAQQKIKYGVQVDQKKYSSTKVDLRNGVTSPSLYQAGYLLDSELKRYSVHVSDEIELKAFDRELVLTPALRLERQEYRPESSAYSDVQDRNFNYASPSFAVIYKITPANYTYAKYTRGARIPSPTEMGGIYQTTASNPTYIVIGNSNLNKETSDAFEIGLKNTSIDGLKFDVTAFYTKYKDFIDYYNYGSTAIYPYGFYRAENLANANIWGAELSTHIELGKFMKNADGFSVALVAGKTKGTSKNKKGEKGSVNSVQPKKGSLTIAYDDPNKIFGLGITATAVGGKTASKDVSQYNDETTDYRRVAGYTIFDLAAHWNVNKHTKLNIALNNILDKTYWDYAAVGMLSGEDQTKIINRAAEPGRNIVASVEFKF